MTDPPPGHQSEQKGLLHVFSAHGLVPVADIAFITKGMAWDAAQRHFYLSHSTERRIYRVSYDRESGRLSDRRAFADLQATPGIPDGAAMDAAGQ